MGDAADDAFDEYMRLKADAMDHDEYQEIEVVFKHATKDAVLFAYENEEHWVPRRFLSWKSDCLVGKSERLDTLKLQIRSWFLDQEGWV